MRRRDQGPDDDNVQRLDEERFSAPYQSYDDEQDGAGPALAQHVDGNGARLTDAHSTTTALLEGDDNHDDDGDDDDDDSHGRRVSSLRAPPSRREAWTGTVWMWLRLVVATGLVGFVGLLSLVIFATSGNASDGLLAAETPGNYVYVMLTQLTLLVWLVAFVLWVLESRRCVVLGTRVCAKCSPDDFILTTRLHCTYFFLPSSPVDPALFSYVVWCQQ
jgi:hypothetical protein